jgi:hypothetical protein
MRSSKTRGIGLQISGHPHGRVAVRDQKLFEHFSSPLAIVPHGFVEALAVASKL